MLNNRLVGVVDRLIASNQTVFIKGRYILESVEIIHEVHNNKEERVMLKLDYEKAYDRLIGTF